MPIYEYICHDCGTQYEMLRSIKDADNATHCKKCNSHNTDRSISVFFAQSGGRVVAGNSGGCSNCTTSSCSGCNHN